MLRGGGDALSALVVPARTYFFAAAPGHRKVKLQPLQIPHPTPHPSASALFVPRDLEDKTREVVESLESLETQGMWSGGRSKSEWGFHFRGSLLMATCVTQKREALG